MKKLIKIRHKVINNADRITSIAAVVGVFTTVGLAINESRRGFDILDRAVDDIEGIRQEAEEKQWPYEDEERAIRDIQIETAKDLAINYTPTIIGVITTSICILGSNKISRDRNAVAVGALNASNLIFQEYRDHVRKAIGEKKETEIHDQIQQEHATAKMLPPKIIDTGSGETLCYIELEPGIRETGLYFLSSPEAVHAAVNDANAEGLETGYVSLADFLYFLKLKLKNYSGSTLRGWKIQSRSDFIKLRETSFIHESGRPVLAIAFWDQPYQGFDKFG